jgi:hypothetical protein
VPPDVQAISPPISKLRFATLTKGVNPALQSDTWLADWHLTNSCHPQAAASDASFRVRSVLRSGQGSGSAGSPESGLSSSGLEGKVHNAVRRGLNETISRRSSGDVPRAGQPDPCGRAVSYGRPLSENCAGSNPDAILRIDSAPGGRLSAPKMREAK